LPKICQKFESIDAAIRIIGTIVNEVFEKAAALI